MCIFSILAWSCGLRNERLGDDALHHQSSLPLISPASFDSFLLEWTTVVFKVSRTCRESAPILLCVDVTERLVGAVTAPGHHPAWDVVEPRSRGMQCRKGGRISAITLEKDSCFFGLAMV